MIIGLLILILATLLFGAGVVKGWLRNLVGLVIGLAIVSAIVLFVTINFGETAINWMLGISLIGAMALWLGRSKPQSPFAVGGSQTVQTEAEDHPVERVWGWHIAEVMKRFSERDRIEAMELYRARDARGLDQFCRDVMARDAKPNQEATEPKPWQTRCDNCGQIVDRTEASYFANMVPMCLMCSGESVSDL